jgi:Flp pilus assembly protein TadG
MFRTSRFLNRQPGQRAHSAGVRSDGSGLLRARPSRRRLSRRGGSVIVVVALGLTALFGVSAIVVDYSLVVHDANRMQRVCDAAALAGVQELKKSGSTVAEILYEEQMAKYQARRVAWENGVRNMTDADVQITGGTRVAVTASTTRNFFFAPILGQGSKVISRRAAATVEAVSNANSGGGGGSVAPIGITLDTYNAYKNDFVLAETTNLPITREITLIRQNKEQFGKDDFALFDLRDNNAKSPAQFYDQLIGQDVETTYVNNGAECNVAPLTCENTLNAAQPATSKKLEDGLNVLFDRASGAPWNDGNGGKALDAQKGTLDFSSPRVVSLLVTQGTEVPNNGTFDTPVLGYAPVYLQSIEERTSGGNGKKSETYYVLKVAFLGPMQAAEGATGAGSNPGPGGMTGLRVTSLSE